MVDQLPNPWEGYTILSRKLAETSGSGGIFLTNGCNLLIRQLGAWVGLPSGPTFWVEARSITVSRCLSSLSHHIRRVIGVGSEEQVFWVAANEIVAVMKNAEPLWNWTVRNSPDKAVYQPVLALDLNLSVAAVSS